jgi:multiple sugar transport system ATP-binding protein
MNFLCGTLAHDRFDSEGLTLAVDMHHQGEAVLGVRPEECSLVAVAGGEFVGRIYSVELIGDHSLVTLNVGGAAGGGQGLERVRRRDRHRSRPAREP